MFTHKKIPLSVTLFFIVLVISSLVANVEASIHQSGAVVRRDHTNLKRFIKKRADATSSSDSNSGGIIGDVVGALSGPEGDPPADGTNTTITSSTTLSGTETTTSITSTSTTTTTSTTDSLTTSNTTTISTTSSKTTSSSLSQTSLPSQTSTTPVQTETQTQTQTNTAENQSSTVAPPTSGLSSTGKTTLITVIIVVAASVGGVVILWTIFRKWKLGRSTKFDQRLQPIDWQPPTDDDAPVHHRSAADNASIRSGSGYGATSRLDHGLEHDFTAGPTHLAPVGGYADLARGPSPQPHMQEAMSHGPSMTRSNYDASLPLHHQNNYGVQDAYGGRY